MSNKVYHSLKFAAVLVIFILGSGCANQNLNHGTKHIIEIDSTELAHYWVAQDKLIDWQYFLPVSEFDDSWDNSSYKVSFIVDSQGYIQQASMQNTDNGNEVIGSEMSGIEGFKFYPTARNITRQAVRINSIVKL
ncbi:hypothetical protein L2747_16455 [Shewanella marinintestina]|uniref:hypothetical protein n=1 Tax=Shewanella marinintestina TaxID=190305 RepID=UPI00200C364E|nr:hypothetical protein [Shewanella marinintestina]MCL1147599.1 hypothetical protein [Shewanella marinintestina]